MALEKTVLGELVADDGAKVTVGVVATPEDLQKLGAMTPAERAAHQTLVANVWNLVAPKDNWKNPVWALIEDNETVKVAVAYAIEFFTGTEATFAPCGFLPGFVVVTAPGYYGGPCN